MEDNEIELESVVIDSNAELVTDSHTELAIDSNTELVGNDKANNEEKTEKLVRFPITRIKHLVKMDPDVNLCSHDALFLITKATELFVECLSKEAYAYTSQVQKKTVQKRDVEQSIEAVDALAFLEGILDS